MAAKTKKISTEIEASWPASDVSLRAIDEIVPYANNPRTHPAEQIRLLAASMKQEGVTAPILVDEAGIIIAGHGRRLAAIENGFTRYPVVVARGWSDEQKRSVRLKDNQIGLLSGWNLDLVATELSALKIGGYEIEMLGFPEVQLRTFGVLPGTDGLQDPENTPDPPKNPISQKGDLWVLGQHRLLCGDSTNAEDVSRLLGDKIPLLMVTDQPYGVEYDADWRNKAARTSIGMGTRVLGAGAIGKVLNDDRSDWREAWSLFPGDVAYVWHASLKIASVQVSLEAAGFVLRNQIIWAKQQFAISQGDYHWMHEPCFYAVRKGKTGHWAGDRKQTTLWQIPKPQKSETGHSTQKPIECMRRPIENNSKIGDFVYEPFCGSGTTIIAGEMTKRWILALELSAAYVDVAVERWQAFTNQKAVLEGTGRTFAETGHARLSGKEMDDEAGCDRKPAGRRRVAK